ncbi:MAG: DUF2207 family protein, partial [Clostridium sp.]
MKRVLSFTIVFLLFFSFVTCFADNISKEIYKVDIDAVIMDNGDVNVTEYLYYRFNGDFTNFVRDINTNGSDGCTVNSVSVIDKDRVENVAKLSDKSEENTYTVLEDKYKTSVTLYSKSSNENKILKVDYTAKNVAKIYNSKGELYWSFYSVEKYDNSKEMNINISFDNEKLTEENSEYKIFGAGEGYEKGYVDGKININCEKLESMIGIDLIMPAEFFKNISNIINDDIESNENKDTINSTSSQNEGTFFTLIIGGVIVLILILIRSENKKQTKAIEKYRSEYKFTTNNKYVEPPSNISPALVNLLLYNKEISRDMISSTLFYLCNLGYYSVKELKSTEKGLLGKKYKYDLIFKRDVNINSPSEPHLNFIIELFYSYEKNNEFSLMEIEESLKKSSEVKYFANKLNEWRVEVIKDSKEREFFIMVGNREV